MSFDDDVRDRGPVDRLGTDGAGMVERLVAIAAELGADELRVLVVIAERLRIGQRRYGRFDLGSDRRDFGDEALAEMLDFSCYVSCALIRGRA